MFVCVCVYIYTYMKAPAAKAHEGRPVRVRLGSGVKVVSGEGRRLRGAQSVSRAMTYIVPGRMSPETPESSVFCVLALSVSVSQIASGKVGWSSGVL